MDAMGHGAVPEANTLRETLADIRQQLERKKLRLQNVARYGQEIVAEEETLRRKLEEAHKEVEIQGDAWDVQTQKNQSWSQVERMELQNQHLAEELEEMEKELATSPPRRRVHSEVLRANEHRIEVLRQELGEERHTEETQEVRWQREERTLSAELQEAKQQDEAMLKALTNKLQSLQEKNRKLKEDLLLEEEKTEEKTSFLEAEAGRLRVIVAPRHTCTIRSFFLFYPSFPFRMYQHALLVCRLRGSLWWFTQSSSELWSGSASEASAKPSPSVELPSARPSVESRRRSVRSSASSESEPRARRRATRSFKPLEDMAALSGQPTHSTSATSRSANTLSASAAATASALARRASATIGGFMDDALLNVGELLGEDSKASASAASVPSASASKRSSVASSERSVEDTKNKDAQARNVGQGPVPTFTELWEASSSHRASATSALAQFGALLQQQVNSAADFAATESGSGT
eukprot:symbB.v1.2.025264.t1/scaffold2444.1/size78941/5